MKSLASESMTELKEDRRRSHVLYISTGAGHPAIAFAPALCNHKVMKCMHVFKYKILFLGAIEYRRLSNIAYIKGMSVKIKK